MKAAISALVLFASIGLSATVSLADTGDFELDRNETWKVARGEYDHVDTTKSVITLVRTPQECGIAGEGVARAVFIKRGGKTVLAGYRCEQDNRGSGN